MRPPASGEHPQTNVTLGATVSTDGVTFAVWSAYATQITLSTFEEDGAESLWKMRPLGDGTHAVFVRGAREGLRYGYRAHGPWAPDAGHRFNPNKLLLDPYARRILGGYDPNGPVVDHVPGDRHRACNADSAAFMPRSVVARPLSELPLPEPLHALEDSVVYEAHVARLTELCTRIPVHERGRFAALTAPVVGHHLRSLGVTALELMPVQARMSEPRLLARGLQNEWGYSPVGFFALDERFAEIGADPRLALRAAVSALRAQGIEVWLDMVFNHTAELDLDGPVFHLRGLDHKSYYRLDAEGRPVDTTGCGNTVRAEHPRVVQLICAALREMVIGLGVSGVRFDLGLALAREEGRSTEIGREAIAHAALFSAMENDPVLSRVRRVVEPWDTAGYALGGFSKTTLEWNDRYRDGVRRFFLGDGTMRGDFATRVAGSSDVFGVARGPRCGVNFVTAHDGFTLADLVEYTHKHNEANGEDNRDGHEPNYSENFGVEGPSSDPEIVAARRAKQKALLLTLLMSAGTPMLAMGDEVGRTQHGNNNGYCQIFPMAWPSTPAESAEGSLLAFVQRLAALRASLPELARSTFFTREELMWLEPDGTEVTDWHEPSSLLAARLHTHRGVLWLAWNGGNEPRTFLPPGKFSDCLVLLRSDEEDGRDDAPTRSLTLRGRSAAAVLFAV